MARYGKKTRRATPKKRGVSKKTQARKLARALKAIETVGSAARKAWLADTKARLPRRKREPVARYNERLAEYRRRSLVALRGAVTRVRAAAKREKVKAAVDEAAKAREEKLKGTPGAKKRFREAKAVLQTMVESEDERQQREFREKLDAVFKRKREEAEALERKRAEQRLKRAEEERLAAIEQVRDERAAAAVAMMRKDLATLAAVAREMLPDMDARASMNFGAGRETRGHKRDIRIDRIVEEGSVARIVRKVRAKVARMPGKFPFWLITLWMSAVGDQVVGSFKIRTDHLTRDQRTVVETHLQSLMTDSTGIQKTREAALEVFERMLQRFNTPKFARTIVYLHAVSVWNYTKVRVSPGMP